MLEIIYKRTKDLIPYEKNPRKNNEAVPYVMESIKEFGFKIPIVIDKENVIVAGHTRLKAAKKLKLEEVPCIVADDLTEEELKAFRLADNKVAEKAEWDFDLLGEELDDIFNIDMEALGFELTEEEKEVVEDDFDEEPPEEPKSKLGDIYQLGRHRLMCGDSTSLTDVEKLMDGELADMVFTDPPYGMKKEKDGVANDNLNPDALLEFNKEWIPLSFNVLKENGSWYCWGTDEPLMDIYANILKPMAKENLITFRNLITWEKESAQGQRSETQRMYPIADEKCLFVMCGVQGFNNNAENYFEAWEPIRSYMENEMEKCGGRKNWRAALGNEMGKHYFTKSQWSLPTEEAYEKLQKFGEEYGAFKREYEEIKREYEEIKREYYSTRAFFNSTHDNMNNVWHFNKARKEERVGHATPKPLALCSRAIKSSSREGELILDMFGGGGSTLIACEQLDRRCYMMELEPKWVDTIIKRWETLTGEKAVLLNE